MDNVDFHEALAKHITDTFPEFLDKGTEFNNEKDNGEEASSSSTQPGKKTYVCLFFINIGLFQLLTSISGFLCWRFLSIKSIKSSTPWKRILHSLCCLQMVSHFIFYIDKTTFKTWHTISVVPESDEVKEKDEEDEDGTPLAQMKRVPYPFDSNPLFHPFHLFHSLMFRDLRGLSWHQRIHCTLLCHRNKQTKSCWVIIEERSIIDHYGDFWKTQCSSHCCSTRPFGVCKDSCSKGKESQKIIGKAFDFTNLLQQGQAKIVDARDKYKRTPLTLAAMNGNYAVLTYLLRISREILNTKRI